MLVFYGKLVVKSSLFSFFSLMARSFCISITKNVQRAKINSKLREKKKKNPTTPLFKLLTLFPRVLGGFQNYHLYLFPAKVQQHYVNRPILCCYQFTNRGGFR